MPSYVRTRTKRHRKRRFVRGGGKPVRRYALIKALRRVNRRIPRPQRKYLDVIQTSLSFTAEYFVAGPYSLVQPSGSLASTSDMAQGVTQNQMIGYKGMWKTSLHRIALTCSANNPNILRVIHFFWKPNEFTGGAASNGPGVGQILQQGNAGSSYIVNGTSTAFLSPYNLEWSACYKIIHDETYTLTNSGWNQVQINKTRKKLNHSFRCNQPNGPSYLYGWTPYVMFVSNYNASADQPAIQYYHRLGYVNF